MAATENINIRVAPERKAALKELADAFGESVTEFVMKSVFMRVRAENPVRGAVDPFVVAMRSAAAGHKKALSPSERGAVQRSRSGKGRRISIDEARKRLALD